MAGEKVDSKVYKAVASAIRVLRWKHGSKQVSAALRRVMDREWDAREAELAKLRAKSAP